MTFAGAKAGDPAARPFPAPHPCSLSPAISFDMICRFDTFERIQGRCSLQYECHSFRFSNCPVGLVPNPGGRVASRGRCNTISSNRRQSSLGCSGFSFSPPLNLEADSFVRASLPITPSMAGHSSLRTAVGIVTRPESREYQACQKSHHLRRKQNPEGAHSPTLLSEPRGVRKGNEKRRTPRQRRGAAKAEKIVTASTQRSKWQFGNSKARVQITPSGEGNTETARKDSANENWVPNDLTDPWGLRCFIAFPEARGGSRESARNAHRAQHECSLTS